MKEYRYRATANNIAIYSILLLVGAYVFFFGTTIQDIVVKVILAIVLFALLVFVIQYVSEFIATNMNVRKIILKEDRILIPHIYSDGHTVFYFDNITKVEGQIETTRIRHSVFYTDTVIHLKSGTMFEATIRRSWLENGVAFSELCNEIKFRVDRARKNIPKQEEMDNEHQPYKRKITFESKFHRKRF